MNENESNRISSFKHWWCCLRHRWVVCFERVELADCPDSAVDSVFFVVNDHCCRRRRCCLRSWCCSHWLPNRSGCCCCLPNSDSNCWATTVNWRPIGVKMERPVLECRPTSQALAFPDTIDMVVVFVVQLRPLLGDSTSRQLMVELEDPDHRLLQRQPHTAKHQCKAVHHTIFGMRHSYLWEWKKRKRWKNCRIFCIRFLLTINANFD